MELSKKNILWISVLGAAAGLIYLVNGVLLPFIAGFFIAYALSPLVDKMTSLGMNRTIATVGTIFVTVLLTVGMLIVVLPFIASELFILAHNIPKYNVQFFNLVEPILAQIKAYVPEFNVQELHTTLADNVGNMVAWSFRLLARVLRNTLVIANLVSLIVLTPLIAFYMLRDWPRLLRTVDDLFPRYQSVMINDLLRNINKNLAAYIRGQLSLCLILALYFSITLTVIGLNYAITIGVFAGLLSFIPFVGTFISISVALGVAFSQLSQLWFVGLVLGAFIVGGVLENFLAPQLIGHSIGAHPVWIIFALLSLGNVFGFWGMLFAMPIAAILSAVVRFLIQQYKCSQVYLGYRPKKSS